MRDPDSIERSVSAIISFGGGKPYRRHALERLNLVPFRFDQLLPLFDTVGLGYKVGDRDRRLRYWKRRKFFSIFLCFSGECLPSAGVILH